MALIAAGITVFEPEIERLKNNIETTLEQVDKLYIVDNGSHNTTDLKNYYRDNKKIALIENEQNLGISRALNQMCQAAVGDGFDWILTLDQDSLPEPDLITNYLPYLNEKDVMRKAQKILFMAH